MADGAGGIVFVAATRATGVSDAAPAGATVTDGGSVVSAVGIRMGVQAANKTRETPRRARSKCLFIRLASQHVVNRLAPPDHPRLAVAYGQYGRAGD